MLHQILSVIKKYNMISPGDEVVAALSGGADSVCLLLALDALSERLQISLSAIHVNHCIRGATVTNSSAVICVHVLAYRLPAADSML